VNNSLVGTFVPVLGAVLLTTFLWLASGSPMRKAYEISRLLKNESLAVLT
jgi:hypothetical protein